MNKQKLTLIYPLLSYSFLLIHDKQMAICGNAIFLFAGIFIKKSGDFYINVDKNVNAEKLIINISVAPNIDVKIFFGPSQNIYNFIDIYLNTEENAQLNFNFFIHNTQQIKKRIS